MPNPCSGRRDLKAIDRFWMQTEKKGPNDCWIWKGYYGCGGYLPIIQVNGKQIRAAKFAYEAFVAPMPEGKFACHKCDNPACVNPKHLFAGNQDENMKDMKSKDRAYKPKGEANPKAVLTEQDVRFIRKNYKFRDPKFSQKALAIRFGVCINAVHEVLSGKRWSHVK